MNPFHNAFAATLEFANRCHAGQFDKAGEPYIWHVTRVGASLLPDLYAAIVGLLHDTLEDVDCVVVTEHLLFEHIRNHCVEPPAAELILAVSLTSPMHGYLQDAIKLLTRQPDVPYETYIEILAASGNQLAVKVKLADLRDNLDEDRLRRAYKFGVPIEKLQRLRSRYISAWFALGGHQRANIDHTPVSHLVGEVIHMPPGAVMGSEMIDPFYGSPIKKNS